MRRLAGRALVAAGGCLLLWSGAAYARGALARDAARTRWSQMEAGRAAAGARAFERSDAAPLAAVGAPVARLVIPSLGLDEVVVEGVGDAELRAGPGHLPGTPLPGAVGNAVLSAHRDRHFRRLDEVAIGDTVHTDVGDGVRRWVVSERRIVKAGVPVIHQSPTPQLTLTTCWPVRFLGPAPDRLLLTARPLGD